MSVLTVRAPWARTRHRDSPALLAAPSTATAAHHGRGTARTGGE